MKELVNKKIKREVDEVNAIHKNAHAAVRTIQINTVKKYEDAHGELWRRVTGCNKIV